METESNGPSLDLKLCNDHEGGGGDGLKQSSPAASQSSNEAEAELPIEGERKNYYCKYCNKRFSNSQALGGHQNAHKRERSMAKKDKGLQEAALAAIESRLHPFSTINSTFGSPLGVQRQSFIRKPFNFDCYAGTGYDNYIGGGDSSSGYSNQYRPFPIMNGTTNYRYAIQTPPNMNSYWDGDAGYQSRPRPQATAKPFNVGGYQAALPARVSNVCGPTVNQPSFAWPVGASNSVNDKISGSSGQLLFQRHEAEVRVPTTEKQIAPAIDLTLKL